MENDSLKNEIVENSSNPQSEELKKLYERLDSTETMLKELLNKNNSQNLNTPQKWQKYEQTDLEDRGEIIVEAKEIEEELTIKDRLDILNSAESMGTINSLFDRTEQDLNSDLSALYFLSKVGKKYFPNLDIAEDFYKLKRAANKSLNHFWLA